MTRERTPTEDRATDDAAIDAAIHAALDPDSDAEFPTARDAVAAGADRWYGRLLVRSHDAAAGATADEAVSRAAAAFELLRGYCRLRNDHLAHRDEGPPSSTSRATSASQAARDPTAPLLAGDYLLSVAFSTLGTLDHPRSDACFRLFRTTTTRVIETTYTRGAGSAALATEYRPEGDGTDEILGRGAAVAGALLAGIDESRRDTFASLGRALGSAYRVRRVLDSGTTSAEPEGSSVETGGSTVDADRPTAETRPSVPDEHRLRRHGARRSTQAADALRDLSGVADVERLRPLVDDIGAFER